MPPITDYVINANLIQEENELGERVALNLGTLGGNYSLDQDIEVTFAGENRQFFISGLKKDLLQRGRIQDWITSIQGSSPIAKLKKKSPKKSQLFITLSQKDYDLMMRSQEEYAEAKQEYLDYNPRIRIGDDYGCHGWTASEIASAISQDIGLPIIWQCPDYDIKEFRVEPSQDYISAVLSLAAPFNPQVFYQAGKLFINTPATESIDPGNILQMAQQAVSGMSEEVIRRDKPSQIRLIGNLGEFKKDKYKGYLVQDPFQEYTIVVGSLVAKAWCYGTATEVLKLSTGNDPGLGGYFEYDTETGIVHNYTLDEVIKIYGLDAFGNKALEIGELRTVYKYRFINGQLILIIFRREAKVTAWQETHEKFQTPKEWKRSERIDQTLWYPSGGNVIFALYPALEEKTSSYLYGGGELLKQDTYQKGVIYTEDDIEFTPLASMSKDDISADGLLREKIVQTENLSYFQHSRDSYGVRRITSRMGKDGKYKTTSDVQVVQAGHIQGSAEGLRRMQPYAESGAWQAGSKSDMTAIMNTPAREIFINTPSWEALDRILPFFQARLNRGEVNRVFEIKGELNVHPGLMISLDNWANQAGEQIPAPQLGTDFMSIISYQMERQGARSITRIVARGESAIE